MEALARGCIIQVQDLDGLQKFRILDKSTEIGQKTSLLGTIFVKILPWSMY